MTIAATEQITEEAYLALTMSEPERQWELWDGQPREKPGMSVEHGWMQVELIYALRGQLDPNEFRLRSGHARLRRSARNYFIPDIAVLPTNLERALRQRPGSLDAYPEALPLVIEIWSPSTGGYDVDTKVPEYQRRGDIEIWRLHPYQQTLTAWVIQPAGRYVESIHRGGVVVPVWLTNVAIDLDALLSA